MSVTQFKFAGALVLAISVVAAMSALAATDPYPTGLTGYDVSYPQCGGTAAAGSFRIVGVNAARPLPHKTRLRAGYAKVRAEEGTPGIRTHIDLVLLLFP